MPAPNALRPGDIVRCMSRIAGKPKYHLCVRAGADGSPLFVLMNTGHREPRRVTDLLVPCRLVPVPPSRTGFSEFSCSLLLTSAEIVLAEGRGFAPIGGTLARRLATHWNKAEVREVHHGDVWQEVLDALVSIDGPDPSLDELRRLKAERSRGKRYWGRCYGVPRSPSTPAA